MVNCGLGRVELGRELVVDRGGEDAPDGLAVDVDPWLARIARWDDPRDGAAANRYRERLACLGGAKDG